MTQNVAQATVHENSPDFAVTEGLRAFGERLVEDTDLKLLAVRHTRNGYALVLEQGGKWHQVIITDGEMKDVASATPEHDVLVKRLKADAHNSATIIDHNATTSVPPGAPPAPVAAPTIVRHEVVAEPEPIAVKETPFTSTHFPNLPKMAGKPKTNS